jgi:hypothetical protein
MESIGVVINAKSKQDDWIRYFISIDEEIIASISISVFNPDRIKEVSLVNNDKVEVLFDSGKSLTLFRIQYQSTYPNLRLNWEYSGYSWSDFEYIRLREHEIIHTEESWANEPNKENPLRSRWNFLGSLPDRGAFFGKHGSTNLINCMHVKLV